MKNYKMTIAYDGRRYMGFTQKKQPADKSVQGKLEQILEKLYGQEIEVISAVNTDAGVHARHQVINFEVPNESQDSKGLFDYFEKYLPDDIIVIAVEHKDDRFHSRYLAKSLTYEYTLWKVDAPHRPLFERQYVNVMVQQLDTSKMKKAAKDFIGEHDFAAFTPNKKAKNTVKNIYSVDIEENEFEIIIRIKANSFLVNMERIMAGTLIQSGLGQLAEGTIKKAFETKNSDFVGHKASAGALTLVDVEY